VHDVDRLHADVQSRGAVNQAPPHAATHGVREIVFEDLNGCRLAFVERSQEVHRDD
jgi:hypothetical protein